MSTPFHNTVRLHTIKNEHANRTVVFTLPNGMKAADVLGRALTVDTSAPCKMKLAADGDPVVARLEVYEDRGLATAQFSFTDLIPIKAGSVVNVGDTVVGAGDGLVKAAAAADPLKNWVAEIITKKGVAYASVVRMS